VHPPSEVTPAASEETALVAKAQAGDAQAFTDLVNRYERKIYRIAKHITQNDEDAEDVLQETFLKAYEHLGGFQGNSKFYTWIVRIAVNESLMKLRKRKGDRTVPLDAHAYLPTDDGACGSDWFPAESTVATAKNQSSVVTDGSVTSATLPSESARSQATASAGRR